jgi:Ca-activated chloride channel family protein
MIFDNPLAFMGFFLLIPFAILECVHYYARRKALKSLKLPKEMGFRAVLSFLFFVLFISCCIVAFAGPRWGMQAIREYRQGIDIVFAFDVSRSMEVQDVAPSRLGRAVIVAQKAVAELGDVRLGAAIGKGKGVLALPLTWDKNTLSAFLDALLTESITGSGTDLENLVDAAQGAFWDAFPAKRLVVLFSDGESLSGSLQSASDRLSFDGITLVTVGFGTEEGGTVPARVFLTSPGELVLDDTGSTIISSRNSEALRNAAERSEGVYIDGNSGNAADMLVAYIQSLSQEIGINSFRMEAKPQWMPFMLAAFLCLVLAKLAEKKFA